MKSRQLLAPCGRGAGGEGPRPHLRRRLHARPARVFRRPHERVPQHVGQAGEESRPVGNVQAGEGERQRRQRVRAAPARPRAMPPRAPPHTHRRSPRTDASRSCPRTAPRRRARRETPAARAAASAPAPGGAAAPPASRGRSRSTGRQSPRRSPRTVYFERMRGSSRIIAAGIEQPVVELVVLALVDVLREAADALEHVAHGRRRRPRCRSRRARRRCETRRRRRRSAMTSPAPIASPNHVSPSLSMTPPAQSAPLAPARRHCAKELGVMRRRAHRAAR